MHARPVDEVFRKTNLSASHLNASVRASTTQLKFGKIPDKLNHDVRDIHNSGNAWRVVHTPRKTEA